MGSIVTECILRGNYKIIILLIRKENLCHIRMIMVMHGYFRIKDHIESIIQALWAVG